MKAKNIIFCMLLCVLYNSNMHASIDSLQTNHKQQYMYAIKLLDGVNTEVNYTKARKILSQLASQGYAPAMRTWGTIYNNGLGVIVNKEKAFKAYYKAAKYGDAKSMTNLGLMYQNGDYVTIDFKKAMVWYKKGLDAGDQRNYYNIGYLYYKGYGVEQSYSMALQYFQSGAKIENEGICKYMIGICYMKGYGVKKNEDVGKSWMEKSANNGYERAIDYILNYQPQAPKDSIHSRGLNIPSMPNRMPSKTEQLYIQDFSGEWEGTFYVMDWSRKLVEEEYPISLTLIQDANQIEGIWELNETEIPFQAFLREGGWEVSAPIFKSTNGRMQQMQYCNFIHTSNNIDELLQGDIQIKRIRTNEPARPNYFHLRRKTRIADSNLQNIHQKISIWPNPINSNKFTVSLYNEIERTISISIYNINGLCILKQEYTLNAGNNNLTLQVNLQAGVYTLIASGQNYYQTKKIIRK